MSRCIWYVSKYVITPAPGEPAGRSFGIMREFARLGHRSVVVTSDSMGKFNAPVAERSFVMSDQDGVTICRARTFKYLDSNSVRRMVSWLHFEWKLLRLPLRVLPPPDVVIVSSLSLLTILNGLRLRRRFKCPLVFEVRDIWPLTLTEEGNFSPRNPLVRALGLVERLGYRRADLVVGTMPNLGEHVRNVVGEPRRVECVPMGVDLEAVAVPDPVPADFVSQYIPQNRFIVGYAGSLGISNAMDVFFECIESMKDEMSIHFLVVGEGELKQRYIDQFGSLPNLTIAPAVPKIQVQSVLGYCDVLYLSVHKSKVWDFGMSLNKVMDYMAAAKPIIASYSGYPSLIDEADCGEFVEAQDCAALEVAIRKYAQMSSETLDQMGQRGRRLLTEQRSFEALAVRYLDLIASVRK